MIPQLMAALRSAIPGADVRLLDATPSPVVRNTPHRELATPPAALITVRLLISTNGLEAAYETVLAELMRNPVLDVDGQSVRTIIVPASVDEKVRLWLALGTPFVPSILLEAGPLEV